MNFFLLRDGQKQGPHPLSSLPEMRRYGGVLNTDEILVDGAPGWVRVADYLPAAKTATPPVIATPPSGANRPAGVPPLPIRAALSAVPQDELAKAVEAGGRFVLYSYCISVLVMTFRRPSEITFLRRDQDGAADAIKFSLISGALGWWGIPWGPIWTIAALITNASGGKDVTLEVLTDKYGVPAANALLARRQKPAPVGGLMKTFRVALMAAPVLLIGLILLLLMGGVAAGSGSSRTRSAFEMANEQISTYHNQVAFGNSDKAVAVAGEVSRALKVMREAAFEGGKKNGVSMSRHEFLTYCELRDGQCIVMAHVPELRRFNADAKDALARLAWGTTQSALRRQNAGTPDMKVLVGLRGIALYERVMKGDYVADAAAKGDGLKETVKDGRGVLEAAFE
ncbi:MAG TPA: hypothetical protein VGF13_00880 [Verrucomicrobiae bacterium]|jgi:hypothetical protein